MSPVDSLYATAERLRTAVASGAHAQAQETLRAYGHRLEEVLRSLPPTDPRAIRLAAEARELLEWAHRTVMCSRAHSASQLARLSRQPLAYRTPASPARHSWELEG